MSFPHQAVRRASAGVSDRVFCEPLESRRLLTSAVDAALIVDGSEQALEVTFNDVPPSVDHGDVKIGNLAHAQYQLAFNYELDSTSGNVQTYAMYQELYSSGSSQYRPYVPNGNYEVRLEAQSHPDLTDDYVGGFHFLRGDINGDRAITSNDIDFVNDNEGAPNATYSMGDVDYDGDIDYPDKSYLASVYGNQLSPPPVSVGDITVDAVGTSANAITWHADPTEHDAYYLYRSTDGVNFTGVVTDGGGPFQVPSYDLPVADLGLNGQPGLVTWTDDTNVQAGTKYWYRVRGYSTAAGLSHTTSKDWAVTTLPAPANVSAVSVNDYEVELTWDAANVNATELQIWAKDSNGELLHVATLPATETAYTVSGNYTGLFSFAVVAANDEAVSPQTFTQDQHDLELLPVEQGFSFLYDYGINTGEEAGVSVSPEPGDPNASDTLDVQVGETEEFTVSGLPPHKYVSAVFLDIISPADGIEVTIAGTTFDSLSTELVAHSGGSLTISISNNSTHPAEHPIGILSLGVSVYNPAVNVGFTGSSVEEGLTKPGTVSLSHRLPEDTQVSFWLDKEASTSSAQNSDFNIQSVTIPEGEMSAPIIFEATQDSIADGEVDEDGEYLLDGAEVLVIKGHADNLQPGNGGGMKILDDSEWVYSAWEIDEDVPYHLLDRSDLFTKPPLFSDGDVDYIGYESYQYLEVSDEGDFGEMVDLDFGLTVDRSFDVGVELGFDPIGVVLALGEGVSVGVNATQHAEKQAGKNDRRLLKGYVKQTTVYRRYVQDGELWVSTAAETGGFQNGQFVFGSWMQKRLRIDATDVRYVQMIAEGDAFVTPGEAPKP